MTDKEKTSAQESSEPTGEEVLSGEEIPGEEDFPEQEEDDHENHRDLRSAERP